MSHTWGKPARAKNWHIFGKDKRSLCCHYMLPGADQEVDEPPGSLTAGESDCGQCVRVYNRLPKPVAEEEE